MNVYAITELNYLKIDNQLINCHVFTSCWIHEMRKNNNGPQFKALHNESCIQFQLNVHKSIQEARPYVETGIIA